MCVYLCMHACAWYVNVYAFSISLCVLLLYVVSSKRNGEVGAILFDCCLFMVS